MTFVLDHHVAHWTIAASARIGQVYGGFATLLSPTDYPPRGGNRSR